METILIYVNFAMQQTTQNHGIWLIKITKHAFLVIYCILLPDWTEGCKLFLLFLNELCSMLCILQLAFLQILGRIELTEIKIFS
jgi:hypothetical protein